MKLFRLIAGLTLALLIAGPVMGQKKRDLVIQADKTFAIGEYFNAIEKYKKAYSREKDRTKRLLITLKIGNCYRMINDTRKAETYYSRVVKQKLTEPKAHLYYADMLKENGKTALANAEYEEYLKSEPGDLMALMSYQSCDSILVWSKNPTRYQIASIKEFNSKYNDYSPYFASKDYKELYISSSRDGANGTKKHGGTGQSFSDIFITRLDNKQKWAVPAPVDKTINSIYDDGTPWISPDGNVMYFSRCRYDKQASLGCQIMMSKRTGSNWADPVAVPIAKDSVVIAHPSLTEDQLTIFFVSDMLGSIGGKDIWKAVRTKADGPFGAPENLGEIVNTTKNEMFPFVKSDTLFYFSSNGHPGMGGLDIFKAHLDSEKKWVVENMKFPINSSADDFGIIFQKEEEKGYFTSSRIEKSLGGDEIYSFVLPEKRFNMAGRVISESTTLPLKDADVRLIGSDGTSMEYKTDSTGTFTFKLKAETDYLLVAFKRGYLNGKLRETTMGLEVSRDFNATLTLATYEKPIELPNILYDLAKWDLRPESMVALDALVETLEDNPNITIELMSHTDVRPFRAMTNLELSQHRAESVVDYLIKKGIESDRLKAQGYGPDLPRVVDAKIASQYDFLKAADTLSKVYIDKLPNEQNKEIAHQLNRRTEFRVLRNDYVPGGKPASEVDAQQQLLKRGLEELQQGAKKKIINQTTGEVTPVKQGGGGGTGKNDKMP